MKKKSEKKISGSVSAAKSVSVGTGNRLPVTITREKEIQGENQDALPKLKRHKRIRVFEGFAGYGGASFGLRRSGVNFEVVGYSENDKFASALFDANFVGKDGKPIHNWGDITKINPNDLPDFDLFTGGFPCQPFSSVGLQRGELDTYGRGTLCHDIIRICNAKRPRFILLENVKGLTAKKFQGTFDAIKDALRQMGYGEMCYAILNTLDYGIPQNRERLWMFAMQGGLPKGFSMIPPKRILRGRVKDFLDDKPSKEMYLSVEQIERLKVVYGMESFVVKEPCCFDLYNRKIKTDGICNTILAPEHNKLRILETPKGGRKEIVRKLTVSEQFRFMGFKDGEINFAGQSYSQLSKRAANGWDVNLVGILFNHIFNQIF